MTVYITFTLLINHLYTMKSVIDFTKAVRYNYINYELSLICMSSYLNLFSNFLVDYLSATVFLFLQYLFNVFFDIFPTKTFCSYAIYQFIFSNSFALLFPIWKLSSFLFILMMSYFSPQSLFSRRSCKLKWVNTKYCNFTLLYLSVAKIFNSSQGWASHAIV